MFEPYVITISFTINNSLLYSCCFFTSRPTHIISIFFIVVCHWKCNFISESSYCTCVLLLMVCIILYFIGLCKSSLRLLRCVNCVDSGWSNKTKQQASCWNTDASVTLVSLCSGLVCGLCYVHILWWTVFGRVVTKGKVGNPCALHNSFIALMQKWLSFWLSWRSWESIA